MIGLNAETKTTLNAKEKLEKIEKENVEASLILEEEDKRLPALRLAHDKEDVVVDGDDIIIGVSDFILKFKRGRRGDWGFSLFDAFNPQTPKRLVPRRGYLWFKNKLDLLRTSNPIAQILEAYYGEEWRDLFIGLIG